MERIIYTQSNGVCAVVIPAESAVEVLMKNGKTRLEAIAFIAKKDVPAGVEYSIVTELQPDRVFRDAWVVEKGKVVVDIVRAKGVAHAMRRRWRTEKLRPFDEAIARQIPGEAAAAEGERVKIRAADSALQNEIDQAKNETELRAALTGIAITGG